MGKKDGQPYGRFIPMNNKRRYITTESFGSPGWARVRDLRRSFVVGDLVTLTPEFRARMPVDDLDLGTYLGIVLEVYENYEYRVVWTRKPISASLGVSLNGDHLMAVENAAELR